MVETGSIYCIENKVNGKKYIGLTKNLRKRFRQHKKNLRNGNHHNRHLQNAWDKYGEINFIFKHLESQIPLTRIEEKEKYYIELYQSFINGYNLTSGGESSKEFSDETIKRMIRSGKEKVFTEEHKKNISKSLKGNNNGMYGRSHSKDTRQKISDANKGKTISEETRKKMSETRKGRKRSEDFKKKISEALKGREFTKEAINKMSKAKKGEKKPHVWQGDNRRA